MDTGDAAYAVLNEEEQERLGEEHPEIRDAEKAMVVAGPRAVVSAMEKLLDYVAYEKKQSVRILEVLTGTDSDPGSVLGEERLVQVRKQAAARRALLRNFPMLSSAEMASLAGSQARNTAALANRLKGQGRIFALNQGRGDLFPAFQFGEDGKPLPGIAEVIRLFEGQDAWSLALWFASPSGWLGGKRPADVVPDDPNGVIDAARRAVEPLQV